MLRMRRLQQMERLREWRVDMSTYYWEAGPLIGTLTSNCYCNFFPCDSHFDMVRLACGLLIFHVRTTAGEVTFDCVLASGV